MTDEKNTYSNSNSYVEKIIQTKTNKCLRNLQSFFNNNLDLLQEKGSKKTNIVDQYKKRAYFISGVKLDEFFEILNKCTNYHLYTHYAECQAVNSGIMIDFDRYQTAKVSQLTMQHYHKLICIISNILNETLLLGTGDVSFKVFIIKKPKIKLIPDKSDETLIYKDGFHLLIPELQVTKGYKKFLLKTIQKRKIMDKVFNDIGFWEDPNDMLDMNSAHVPVLFLGSSKVNNPAYDLVAAYNVSINTDFGMILPTQLNVTELLNNKVPTSLLKVGDSPKTINLVYELSLNFNVQDGWLNKKHIEYRNHLESEIQYIVEKRNLNIIDDCEILENENNVDILTIHDPEASHIKCILGNLDISYATEYKKWFEVLMAIANTNRNYKSLAIWFSHRQPKSWSATEIEKVWDDVSTGRFQNGYTKRSLYYWSKSSNPEKHKEICNLNYRNILIKYVYDYDGIIEQGMVAKILYIMLGSKFIVDEGAGPRGHQYCWYEFVLASQRHKHGEVFKWRKELLGPEQIHLYMLETLPRIYKQISQGIKDRRDESVDVNLIKYFNRIEKSFKTSTTKLHNSGFHRGVITMAEKYFRKRGFAEQLDHDEKVLGVGNGILILGTEPRLINGFHEHKISKFTPVNYIPYDTNNPFVKRMEAVFHAIFPEPDVYNFMMMYFSTGLDGCMVSGLMLFLSGEGSNGKTFVLEMVRKTLGQYGKKLPFSLLTEFREKSSANNSQFSKLDGCRFGSLSESDSREDREIMLNSGRFKEMVSPEDQTSQDKYEKAKEFAMTATLAVAFNTNMKIPPDYAMWRRILYYVCKTRFCRNPDPTNPYEQQDDPDVAIKYPKDPHYLEATLSILVHYNQMLHNKYNYDIKAVPRPTMEAEKQIYQNSQDRINRFITELLVKCPESSKRSQDYSLASIAGIYAKWYNENIHDAKHSVSIIMTRLEKSAISKYLRRRPNNTFVLSGFRIKDNIDSPMYPGELILGLNLAQKDNNSDIKEFLKKEIDDTIEEEIEDFDEFDEFNTTIINNDLRNKIPLQNIERQVRKKEKENEAILKLCKT